MSMEVRNLIAENLLKVVKKITKEKVEISDIQITIPEKSENGDYTANIALKLASIEKGNPRVIAEKIKAEYDALSDPNILKIEIAGPGFINFYLKEQVLSENMFEVLDKGDKFGNSEKNRGKKVIVEFSSPNIAKPFTVGHLRSTIIGAAIANLLTATGWTVYRDNHLGDWGTQFGKQIYAIKTWGNEAEIDKSDNPVKDLVALYIKFHEEAEKDPKLEDEGRAWFKKLEDGDPEARRLWKKCIDWSMTEFGRLYELLGVSFTENDGLGYGESFFEDKMEDVIAELRSKNLLTKSEGADLVFFPDDKYPPLMILKQDGTTLYATRDLATDQFRLKEHGSDVRIINEVGIEQSLYFNQLYEMEKMLGWVKDGQRIHIKHGLFRFAEGKMSTRKGNVIWLEDVLEEAIKRAKDLSKEGESDAKAVAIGAIKWSDLKRNSAQDIVFDWDEILNMEGNSGPYMQYAYVRTQSILSKSQIAGRTSEIAGKTMLNDQEVSAEERDLMRSLMYFPEIISLAANNFAPNEVANYLFDLAQKFNLFYQKQPILKAEDEVRNFRLALTSATGQVIKNGLNLLGINTVEKM